MPVDLSYFFATFAKRWLQEFRGLVKRRIDFTGNAFSPIAPSTRRATRGRRANTRLNRTGLFRERFVVGESGDFGFKVETNDSAYPGSKVSYADVTDYNDAGSPDVNRNIIRPPKIFPRVQRDIEKMGLYRDMEQELNQALEIQMGAEAYINVKQNIKIG